MLKLSFGCRLLFIFCTHFRFILQIVLYMALICQFLFCVDSVFMFQ